MRARLIAMVLASALSVGASACALSGSRTPQLPAAEQPARQASDIAVVRGTELWAVDERGENARKLTRTGSEGLANYAAEGSIWGLQWSPELRRLFFLGGSEGWDDAWSVDLQGATEQIWSDGGLDSDTGANTYLIALAEQPGKGMRLLKGTGDVLAFDPDTGPGAELFALPSENESEFIEFADFEWSPDGRRLAYLVRVRDADAYYPVVTGPEGVPVAGVEQSPRPEAFASYQALSWAPDSRRFAASSPGGTIDLFDETGAFMRTIYRNDGAGTIGTVDWSPDGALLVFSIDDSVWTVGADGQDARELGAGSAPAWVPAPAR